MEHISRAGGSCIVSTLLVDELFDTVVIPQNFTIDRDLDICAVRVHLYKHDTCTTDLTLSLYQENTRIKQVTITASEINDCILGTFAHGMVTFNVGNTALRLKEGESVTGYRWELEGQGGSDTNFMGAVRIYERKIYETTGQGVVNGEAQNDYVEPFHFELFELKYT